MVSFTRWHSNSKDKTLRQGTYSAVHGVANYEERPKPLNQNVALPCDTFRRNLHSSVYIYQKADSEGTIGNPKSDLKVEEGEESRVEETGEEEEEPLIPTKDETGRPLSNWARMKIMMKTYGYVVIPVHWVIAPVWFGGFYYAIKVGVDIEPMLTKIGVSDHHIETLKNSKASTALMAYALYKIFTPLRYTVTLGATEFTIRSLRRRGFIKPTPPKEKTYRQSLKDTVEGVKDRLNKDKDSYDALTSTYSQESGKCDGLH
ncbi:protein FAM210A-like isoform X2 [Apostichopus japonicus]